MVTDVSAIPFAIFARVLPVHGSTTSRSSKFFGPIGSASLTQHIMSVSYTHLDENVACIREYVANIFFYRKNGTTVMIDAGYNYERLEGKMKWLGISPSDISHILITHQDTDLSLIHIWIIRFLISKSFSTSKKF